MPMTHVSNNHSGISILSKSSKSHASIMKINSQELVCNIRLTTQAADLSPQQPEYAIFLYSD